MIMKVIILLFFFMPILEIYPSKEHKIKELFYEAEFLFNHEEYSEALSYYLKIDKTNHTNANIKYKIGICYLNIKFEEYKAIPYLKEATKDITDNYKEGHFSETQAPEYTYYLLGKAYRTADSLDNAIEAYKNYSNIYYKKENVTFGLNSPIYYANYEITACQNAKKSREAPVHYKKTILKELANNKYSNFNPVISNDGSILIYTSKQKFYNAVYMSENKDGKWSKPINLISLLGSDKNLIPTSISFDNTMLLLFNDDIMEGGSLYISYYNKEQRTWSKPEKLPKTINSVFWETHGSFGPSGKSIYFTSNRDGSYGGLDIFVSNLNKKGEWGDPINLGPAINTPLNEETPFITADGKTLFFSSEGHYNTGGFDIMYSTKTDNNKWSKPENIGYPINTTKDDLFFCPANNGEIAYISDKSEKESPVANIYLVEKIPVPAETGNESLVVNSEFVPIKIISGQISSFTSVFFNYDSYCLNELSKSELDSIIVILRSYPNLKLQLTGYSDSSGNEKYNKLLSEKRVGKVMEYFTRNYIATDRIKYAGLGETYPMNFEINNKYNQVYARRVDIDILTPEEDSVYYNNVVNIEYLKAKTNNKVMQIAQTPVYTIQLMAIRKPVELRYFNKLKHIKVSSENNSYYRYTSGEFYKYQDAVDSLKDIKSKGFEQAFIKKIEDIPNYWK